MYIYIYLHIYIDILLHYRCNSKKITKRPWLNPLVEHLKTLLPSTHYPAHVFPSDWHVQVEHLSAPTTIRPSQQALKSPPLPGPGDEINTFIQDASQDNQDYELGCPPSQDTSHHQDYETFLVGDPYKPSFATVTGRGDNPNYETFLGFFRFRNPKLNLYLSLESCVGGVDPKLVGGFNPFEKYWSKWESSPNRGENEKCLKTPPRKHMSYGRNYLFGENAIT